MGTHANSVAPERLLSPGPLGLCIADGRHLIRRALASRAYIDHNRFVCRPQMGQQRFLRPAYVSGVHWIELVASCPQKTGLSARLIGGQRLWFTPPIPSPSRAAR